MSERHIAREITYSRSAATRGGRAVIRVMENATGRLRLIRKVRGYAEDVERGRDFWQVITERYGLDLDVVSGSLSAIPDTGPVVVVSNHPYGILDGLMMGRILSERRGGDFRILANSVFLRAPDLERVILPISFEETKAAAKLNLDTRAEALRYLARGGAIGVFPGGTVSTAPDKRSEPMDPIWRNFTAKMIAKSDAVVVPVYFEGANSRLFQIASRLHSTLRIGLLIREFRARVGTSVRVCVGQPIDKSALAVFRADPTGCMDFLRKATYGLSPKPIDASRLGVEYDARYKARQKDRADGSRGL